MDLDLEVQFDADLERAVLLLGLALVVQIRALEQCFADLFPGHGFEFFDVLVCQFFQLLSTA
jgi:hypothetical protein